ncbi:YolD-like family protein [Bacillus sp. JJ722]|uniref:YolD-like family protein n=1 Tax=Bacillus sp. JJ722 TaxID=3122973 RepID=UPI002FFFD099
MGIKKIKDIGNNEWKPSFFIPEQRRMMIKLYEDFYRQPKPKIDDYELQEIESKVHYAIKYDLVLKITIWNNGFEEIYRGKADYLNNIHKKIRLLEVNGDVAFIKLDDIISVIVEK